MSAGNARAYMQGQMQDYVCKGVGHKQYNIIYVMDEQGGPIEQAIKPMH